MRLLGLKLSVNVDNWPVPLKFTDCGLPVVLSVNKIAAVRDPLAVGENLMLTEHDAPPPTLPAPTGQVSLEIEKSLGLAPPSEIEENAAGLLLVLVTVTLCATLVVPVFCKANVRLEGLKVRAGGPDWPVPETPIDCGLPLALSLKVIAVTRAPTALGENVMLTEHEAPAARLTAPTGQVSFEMEKSPGLAPVSPIDENVTALLPVLLTITLCAALVVPVFCAANVRLPGLKPSVKVGAAVPVPLSAAEAGLAEKLPEIDKAAFRRPVADGVNVIPTLHEALALRLGVQLFDEMAKSLAFAPVRLKPARLTVESPVFEIVKFSAELVVP